MSNRASFTRAKRVAEQQPLELEVLDPNNDDATVVLRFKPKLKAASLEAVGRAQKGEVSGMFDAVHSMCVSDADYQAFLALDLDAATGEVDDDGNPTNELSQFMAEVMGLYGDAPKSPDSSTSSNADGTPSKLTSVASTSLTSPKPSGAKPASVPASL